MLERNVWIKSYWFTNCLTRLSSKVHLSFWKRISCSNIFVSAVTYVVLACKSVIWNGTKCLCNVILTKSFLYSQLTRHTHLWIQQHDHLKKNYVAFFSSDRQMEYVLSSKLYIISKCIDVYEESRTSVKRSFVIAFKFSAVSQLRII